MKPCFALLCTFACGASQVCLALEISSPASNGDRRKKRYNSGFFVRGRQIQVAQGGAGRLFGSDKTKAVPDLHKPPGEWNEWEVTCVGTKLSLKANGKLAWDIDDFKRVSHPLGIEAEAYHIDFRNFRIKKIPADDEEFKAKV